MITGHIAAGIIIQVVALYTTNENRHIPSWPILLGATVCDILWGFFLLLGIEKVRPDPSFEPIGLDLVYIDWTHSFVMMFIWATIWATICFRKLNQSKRIWMWSFVAVLSHLVTDYLVHKPDMAMWPNGEIKYGLGLWESIPVLAWFLELGFILIACLLLKTVEKRINRNRLRITIFLIGMHLMNYPGMFPTNISYTLATVYQHNARMLRRSLGLAVIMAYIAPPLIVSKLIDRKTNEDKFGRIKL